jgi:hypothetical protein
MDHRQVVRTLAAARVALGAALLVAPGTIGGAWVGDAATSRQVKVLARALGARDLALGLGTLRALRDGTEVASWVQMSVLADGVDAVATIAAIGPIGARKALPTVAIAAGSALIGATALPQLD